jgi:hypothetical protein
MRCSNQMIKHNEERLREHIKWRQMFLKLNSSMSDVVYVDEVVSTYIWHVDLKGFVEDKDTNEFVQLKGVETYLWWL